MASSRPAARVCQFMCGPPLFAEAATCAHPAANIMTANIIAGAKNLFEILSSNLPEGISFFPFFNYTILKSPETGI